ncbi:hypothetical protein ACS127_09390 [Amphibacillus sp. Q70]|uniref:hypothetical protein n=1 Tax=Amphibacillus sp. Q70 TaxID=3453416 RepID=UPI003F86B0D8
MKVYIDQQFVIDSKDENIIADEIEKQLEDKKRIISSQYIFNGESITGNWFQEIKLNADTDAQLKLVTEELIVVLKEMKETASEYIIQLETNLPNVIEKLYHTYDNKPLDEKLYNLIEGIEYLLNVAINLNLEKILESHDEMLKELMEVLEANDKADCADLLNYEWLPWLDQYKSELLALELQ